MTVMNYNTYLVRFMLFPVTILVPFYYQLQVQAEVYVDPFTGKELNETE